MNKNDWSIVDSGEVVSPYQLVSRETIEHADQIKHAHEHELNENQVQQSEYAGDSFNLHESADEGPGASEELYWAEQEIIEDEFEEAEAEDDEYASAYSALEAHDGQHALEQEWEDQEYEDKLVSDNTELDEAEDVEEHDENADEYEFEEEGVKAEDELDGFDRESIEDSMPTYEHPDYEFVEDLMDEPEAELEDEYFENLLTSATETADFRILSTESNPPGKTIYINSDLKIAGADKVTGIFVPQSFKPSDHFEIIIYLHGYKYDTSKGPKYCYRGICTTTNAEGYWKNAMFPLREGLNLANRNSILVVPTLGYKSNAGGLIYERGVDLFLNQVLRALVCEKAISPCHTIGKIVLAAHSGGGSPMLRIATHKDKFSKLVKECWAFDALYGGTSEWVRWINANPERKFYSYYLGKTPTYVSESIKKQCKKLESNSIRRSAIAHHWDLVKPYWNERVAANKDDQELMDGEALDEYNQGYLPLNEFEDTEFNYESAATVPKNVEPLDPSSKFHSSRLSSEGNAELDAFKRKVYEAHVRWAQGSYDKSGNKRKFVGNVPDDDLRKWDNNEDVVFSLQKGKKIYKAVVVHKRMVDPLKQLMAAARQKAASDNKNVKIYLSSGYRSASTQFSSWDSNFKKYYNRAIHEGVLKKSDYSSGAVQALNEFIRAKLGAPGYSNHQHGRAVDFFLLEANSAGKMEAFKVDTTSENVKRYKTTWFLKWLNGNAHLYGFKPYVAEPWHWEYWGDIGQGIPAPSGSTGNKAPESPVPRKPSETTPKSVTSVLGWLRGPVFVANIHAKNIATALKIAYQSGIKDENTLTNLIFFTRHQNIPWRALRKEETELVREWLKIRDTEVRPWVSQQRSGTGTTSTGTVTPRPVASSGSSASVNITAASYQGMKGVKVSATARPQKTDIKSPDDKIVVCVSSVEGGFDTVNMYDKGIISWGIMQWTVHAGSLQKMLQYTKKRLEQQGMPFLWNLFGGLELTASGDLQFKGTVYPIKDPNLPLIRLFRGSDDKNLVHFDPEVAKYWAKTFALAGRNALIQQFQMEYIKLEIPRSMNTILSKDLLRLKANKKFSKYINLIPATAGPYERKIAEYISGSLKAKMLFFGMWTNNPSWAKIKLFDAIQSFQKLAGGTGSPSSWKTGWQSAFADEFEKVLRATTVGYWGDAKSKKAGRKSRTEKMMKAFLES